jgi:hypothetical protein
MKSFTRFNGIARCVVFYVAGDEGLGEDGYREVRDGNAKEKQEG